MLVTLIYQQLFLEKIIFQFFLAATAMQRLYHHQGDKAAAKAAEKIWKFLVCQLWQIPLLRKYGKCNNGPKLFQLYVHKDQG